MHNTYEHEAASDRLLDIHLRQGAIYPDKMKVTFEHLEDYILIEVSLSKSHQKRITAFSAI